MFYGTRSRSEQGIQWNYVALNRRKHTIADIIVSAFGDTSQLFTVVSSHSRSFHLGFWSAKTSPRGLQAGWMRNGGFQGV